MQTHPTNDVFWLDFQNRLKAQHPTILDQTNNLNKLIDDTIQDYESNQNIDRTLSLIKQLQDVVECIFDNLSENLTTEEVDSLTDVCRRFNEDPVIWEIRDSHTDERFIHEQANVLRTSVTKDKMSSFVESNFPFGPTKRSAYSESFSPALDFNNIESPQEPKRRTFQSAPAEPQATVIEENQAPQQIANKQENKNSQEVQIEEIKPEVFIVAPPQVNEEVKTEIDTLIKTIIDELAEHKIDNAHDALLKLREVPKSKNFNQKEAEYYQAKRIEHERLFEDVDNLFDDCEQIVRELEDENGYIVEGVKKNFTIKYKQAAGQNISLKMEGIVDVPIFNMIALLYEMEGYSLWMPFCKEGRETKDLGRASKAAYIKFNIPPPVFDREGYVYGNGFDRIQKNGSLLVSARSCHNDEKLCKRYDIPVPAQSKTTRMDLEYMGGAFSPIGSDKMKINLVCKVDLKIKFIPLSLINWIVRKAAQFLIDRLVKKATNFKGTLWERKIQENREFYGWLESKINAYLVDTPAEQQQQQQKK